MRARALVAGLAVAAGIVLVLASCQNPFTSDYEDRIAAVDTVIAPDTVFALESFPVSIGTEVPNACWAKGHDDVTEETGGFLITPYDKAYTGKNACAQVIRYFRHEGSLRARVSGTLQLSVKTRVRSASGADSVAVLHRTITVK